MRRGGRRTILECHAAGEHIHRVRPNCSACREYHPGECELAATVRASTRRPVRVRTAFEYQPIPLRAYDWSAVDDRTYEGSPGQPIGRGPTEQAAIADLLEQMDED